MQLLGFGNILTSLVLLFDVPTNHLVLRDKINIIKNVGSSSVGIGWILRRWISKKLPGDAMQLVQRLTFV